MKKSKKGVKLYFNPQKKLVCLKTLTMSPKKPNSANRRIVNCKIPKFGVVVTAKIIGEKHNLQPHSVVLAHGGRSKDLIGLYLKTIRGKFDLLGVKNRKTSRSLYGIKKI